MAPIDAPILFNANLHITISRALSNVTSSSPSPTISSTPTAFNLTSNSDISYAETLAFSLFGLFLASLGVILAYLQLRKMNIIGVSHAMTTITELGSLETRTESPSLPRGDSSSNQVNHSTQCDMGDSIRLDESAPRRSSTDITSASTIFVDGEQNMVSVF